MHLKLLLVCKEMVSLRFPHKPVQLMSPSVLLVRLRTDPASGTSLCGGRGAFGFSSNSKGFTRPNEPFQTPVVTSTSCRTDCHAQGLFTTEHQRLLK